MAFCAASATIGRMTSYRRHLAALLLLLTAAYISYTPGLTGGFLFDDFVNLDAIGATGPVDNWATFFRYISSGTADPTGRPLALLSFLLDARDWPAAPAPFLRSNLILHLFNGALLFLLLRGLGRFLDPIDRHNDSASLLGAGLWLLHPLFVSTTLYAVQREAMLPGTFILLGLLCYVRGRTIGLETASSRGAIWMISGIVGGTGLAFLSKGNGILLPLLAWVLEATILGNRIGTVSERRSQRRLRWALLILPSMAILLYLSSFLQQLNTPLEHRGWTIGQRLLTESRVLTDYLQLLAVPRSVSTGIYNDAYAASTGLLHPLSTLPSILLVIGLLTLAISRRKKLPTFSAAVLFFLSGHLLESSVVPLELYFEHRNYIPAMLLFWPLARGIYSLKIPALWRTAIALGLLGLLGVTTFQRATLWGQPERLAELWARQNPESSRAQVTAAMMDTSNGRPSQALLRLGPIWRRRPSDLQVAFNYINSACAFRGLQPEDSRQLETALRAADSGLQLVNGWLSKAIETAASGQCRGLTLTETERWVAASQQNPRMSETDVGQEIEPLLAQIALHRGQPDVALKHYDLALAAFTSPDVAARQAALLASNGYYSQAIAHLDTYERTKQQIAPAGLGMPRIHRKILHWQNYWPHEMAVLREKLHAELDAQATSNSPAR